MRTVQRRSQMTAQQRVEAEGLSLPQRPVDVDLPELPEDLTELDDSALMRLLRNLTNWSVYAGTRLALASVEEKLCESTLERHRAISAVANRTEKTVTAAKAKAYENPEFNDAQDAYNSAYATRKLTESIYNATDRKSQVVSRELTRRVGRSDRDGRSDRFNP